MSPSTSVWVAIRAVVWAEVDAEEAAPEIYPEPLRSCRFSLRCLVDIPPVDRNNGFAMRLLAKLVFASVNNTVSRCIAAVRFQFAVARHHFHDFTRMIER